MKNEIISAFAFNTGKLIEDLIDKETNNLQKINSTLIFNILEFRNVIKNSNNVSLINNLLNIYDKHFDIETKTKGEIKR